MMVLHTGPVSSQETSQTHDIVMACVQSVREALVGDPDQHSAEPSPAIGDSRRHELCQLHCVVQGKQCQASYFSLSKI